MTKPIVGATQTLGFPVSLSSSVQPSAAAWSISCSSSSWVMGYRLVENGGDRESNGPVKKVHVEFAGLHALTA